MEVYSQESRPLVWGALGETYWLDQNYLAEGVGKILCHPKELQTLVVKIEAV